MQLSQLQQQLGGALVEHFRRPVCGIYFIFDAADCLLYVGRSRHVPNRIGEHRRGGMQFARAFFVPCTAADVAAKERHFIALLQPPLNKQLTAAAKQKPKSKVRGWLKPGALYTVTSGRFAGRTGKAYATFACDPWHCHCLDFGGGEQVSFLHHFHVLQPHTP